MSTLLKASQENVERQFLALKGKVVTYLGEPYRIVHVAGQGTPYFGVLLVSTEGDFRDGTRAERWVEGARLQNIQLPLKPVLYHGSRVLRQWAEDHGEL